ncbi:hypothetical protein J1N35_003857 [Gossypium stocksii]|uniref:NB-ARC domain-containing protein n=1 Tax=Gossypium stocksii TaxID=47602 RepID=A0A9D3WBP5_9ROSI|nr:hypothetical protein J1N35_003857 [Gossypium stocksii]
MELVGPICEVLKCLGNPTCTYIQHHRKLEERMNDLLAKQRQLNALNGDVELRIKADLGWGRRVRQEVENWLLDVQAINDKIQNIDERMQNVSCFSRARLGKRIAQTVEQVEGIIERGSFTEALVIDNPSTAGVPFQLEHLEGETMVKEDIWNYLMSDEIGMIGVCGMGGIGKTTIMKHIHNQLLEETKALFDKIIWVTVSKELNIPKLQEKLANALNIVDLAESEPKRVAELMEKLGQRRYVLILDDVWEKFSLAEVGIPKPTSCNGSKLVLTSRSIEVCRSMDCKVVKVTPLSHEESMNLFLEHAGRGVLKVPSLKEILDDIVKECDGLPLAIAVIAGSMKGIYDVAEWRNALRELRDHVRSVKGTDVEIYERLKFSFDRLGDLKIQSCFLYCSLYPEDYKISRNELIEYWIDEEFLGIGSRQELYDRGHTILNRLENNCLLEKVGRDTLKMHDVMRDTALYIKSFGPRFMVKSGIGLKELPSKQEWREDLEKVSLMMNNVSEIPPHLSPNCEVLSTLFLQWNMSLERISESFFQHMHNLSILDLSCTSIKQLPNYVSNLEKLNALVLRRCYNLRYVPSLEKLKALRKLDLCDTAIEEVPKGLEMLVNLTYLDLSTESLKEFPMTILPRLSCLQYLIFYSKSRTVKLNGPEAARLRKLENFEGRFNELTDFNDYTDSIRGQSLTSYLLVIAPPKAKFKHNEETKKLKLKCDGVRDSRVSKLAKIIVANEDVESVYFNRENGQVKVIGDVDPVRIVSKLRKYSYTDYVHVSPNRRFPSLLPKKEVILSGFQIGRDPVVLPTDLMFLRILESHNVRSLSSISIFFQQANQLRVCSVEACKGIESILESSLSNSLCSPLENLEYLWLERLDNLHVLIKLEAPLSISSSLPLLGIFSHLKSFVIKECLNMKQLFPFKLAHDLQNLEKLVVCDCVQMEEIISSEEENQEINTPMEFSLPKLRKLELKNLPELKNICSSNSTMVCNSLRKIEVSKCTNLKRMPLHIPLFQDTDQSIPSAHPLKVICIHPRKWWESVEWDYPNAKEVLLPWLVLI